MSWTLIGYSCTTASWQKRPRLIDTVRISRLSWPVPCITMLLADAAGIDDQYLWKTDVRSATVATRMALGTSRETTREEDMAYCLLGIFDVNMSLMYGERRNAFARLQGEIIKTSTDQSIFAWGLLELYKPVTSMALTNPPEGPDLSGRACLASSPADFFEPKALQLTRLPEQGAQDHYYSTNRGIFISFGLLELPTGEWLARLSFGSGDQTSANTRHTHHDFSSTSVCLILRPHHTQSNIYSRRRDSSIVVVPSRYFEPLQNWDLSRRQIYLSREDTESPWASPKLRVPFSFRNAFTIRATYPTFGHLAAGHLHRLPPPRTFRDGRHNLCIDCDEIFIDVVGQRGQSFALHISIHKMKAREVVELASRSEMYECQTESWCATLGICHDREAYSMAELMLNEKPLRHSRLDTRRRSALNPSIKWELCNIVEGHKVGGYKISLVLHALDVREGGVWCLDVTPCAAE